MECIARFPLTHVLAPLFPCFLFLHHILFLLLFLTFLSFDLLSPSSYFLHWLLLPSSFAFLSRVRYVFHHFSAYTVLPAKKEQSWGTCFMRVVIRSFALRKCFPAIFRDKWELPVRGHSYRFFLRIQFT